MLCCVVLCSLRTLSANTISTGCEVVVSVLAEEILDVGSASNTSCVCVCVCVRACVSMSLPAPLLAYISVELRPYIYFNWVIKCRYNRIVALRAHFSVSISRYFKMKLCMGL